VVRRSLDAELGGHGDVRALFVGVRNEMNRLQRVTDSPMVSTAEWAAYRPYRLRAVDHLLGPLEVDLGGERQTEI